jgi:hypothetical protein
MTCSICNRSSDDKSLFEFHHFEPIATRRKTNDGIYVCHQCGDQLHLIFNNVELRIMGASVKFNEKMGKYVNWVKNKPIDTHYSAAAKKRRL